MVSSDRGRCRCLFMRNLIGIVLGVAVGLAIRFFVLSPAQGAEVPEPVDVVAPEESAAPLPFGQRGNSPPPPAPTLPAMVVSDPSLATAVWVVGYVVKGTRINVMLSDGRTYTDADPELTEVRRNSVTIDGKKLFIGAPKNAYPQTEGYPAVPPGAPAFVLPMTEKSNSEENPEIRVSTNGAK